MALMTAALIVTAIGAGVSAYSSVEQGKAQEKLNNYNADVANQAATDKARDGRIMANAQRDRNARIQARQRALYAKAGVSDTTGSPLMIQVAQAGEMEMAALEIEQTSATESAQLRQQAILDRMAGKAARSAGNLNATSTILSGAGNAMSGYAKYKAG